LIALHFHPFTFNMEVMFAVHLFSLLKIVSVPPINLISCFHRSNACVGGSATAAQMAAAMSRSDLVLAASAVGTLGYTIGTPIGLALAKLLTKAKS
jgi:uncharacterized membrane protein